MRNSFILASCLLFMFSCVKKIKHEDVAASLKTAMSKYLNSPVRIDTAHVKFTVLEVVFYEDKTAFLCEFKVNLKNLYQDTTGSMLATITKDFKDVIRKN